jgi:hypothetical protein
MSAIPTKRAGTVRAELLSSGYVITPRSEGGIHVAYILQIDFKGTPAVADDKAPAVGHGSVCGVSHPVACTGRIPSWITNILSMEMPKSLSRIGKCIARDRDQFLQLCHNKTRRASSAS